MNPRGASVEPEQLNELRALGVENGVDLVETCLPKPIGPTALVHSLRDAGFGARAC